MDKIEVDAVWKYKELAAKRKEVKVDNVQKPFIASETGIMMNLGKKEKQKILFSQILSSLEVLLFQFLP